MREKNGSISTKLKSHSMERYFKKKARFADTSSNSSPSKRHRTIDGSASSSQPNTSCSPTNTTGLEESDISVQVLQSNTPKSSGSSLVVLSEEELANLPSDPGLRKQIIEYHPNVRNQVRREYLSRVPCQPRNHSYPYNGKGRRFNPSWFKGHEYWLEYSISKDKLYCLCCYLFKTSGATNFVDEGFCTWKKKKRLQVHVGDNSKSAHNTARKCCEDLLDERVHIDTSLVMQTYETRRRYRVRLKASVQTTRICLRQGLPFRGNFEDQDSINRDISNKEQMAIVLRYVKEGRVIERVISTLMLKI